MHHHATTPRRVGRPVMAVTASAALVGGLLLGTGGASAAPQDAAAPTDRAAAAKAADRIVEHRVSSDELRTSGAATYWTPERMESAIPAQAEGTSAVPTTRTGSPLSVPAAQAAGDDTARRTKKSKRIGRAFYTYNGVNYVCSGAAVNSKSKKMVMTAGHCVHEGRGGKWAKNWIFVPGFGPKQSSTPYGVYGATRLAAQRGWVKKSSFNHDVAVAIVQPLRKYRNFKKGPIVKRVGGYGLSFNGKRKRVMTAIGYSYMHYEPGTKQRSCTKRTRPVYNGRQIQMRCKVLTPGASGGPWIVGKKSRFGKLAGINSNVDRYNPRPTVIRTTYFGNGPKRLYMQYRKTKR